MSARVCVLGPSGRMGRAVLDAAAGRSDVTITAAVDRAGAPSVATAVLPGIIASADLAAGFAASEVYVDFSSPDATRLAAEAARARKLPAVIGTTGLGPEHERAVAAGHDVDYDSVKRHARDGDIGPRPRGEIGVSTVRGGDVIGEHVAYFFGAAERIEIAHRATSRTIFAAGALRAAAWVVGKPPGRYDMQHVLGFAST